MPGPSYYFTLFKKLQVLGHAPAGTIHGAGAGGFNLSKPHAVFGNSDIGPLLADTDNPADSPLWAVLNSRAMGNDGFTTVTVNGVPWPTMPDGTGMKPASWAEFQINAPAPKLVAVLGNWIAAGKSDDVPESVLGQIPSTVERLDDGVVPFVCNMPGDNGISPLPADYWATSLIFLVDPSNGKTISPSHLAGGDEYFLVAIIGNRGNQNAGRYAAPAGPKIEAEAHVMVWNTGMSPAVKLPALSNLDVMSTVSVYESYFLRSGEYDVIGFRLPVQTVFDGLVKAVEESDIDLDGASARDWVLNHPAHLCARVRVRHVNQSWPSLSDPPTLERRIAQKNLTRFAVDLTVQDLDPDIRWHNFLAGDALRLWRFHREWGAIRLSVDASLRRDQADIYLAIPKRTFEGLAVNEIKGFDVHANPESLRASFPQCVVLQYRFGDNSVPLRKFGENELLALSLGIRPHRAGMRLGFVGQVSVVQRTVIPVVDASRDCFHNEWQVTGGFTVSIYGHANER